MKSKTPTLALLVALAGSVSVANAGITDAEVEMKSETITFSRTEAQSTVGALALYSRLKTVASRVCSDLRSSPRESLALTQHCRTESLDAVVKEIDVSTLTAVHEHRGRVEVVAMR